MKVVFYSNPHNKTCREIRKRLDLHNVKYVYKDIKQISLTKEEILFLLDRTENGFHDIISKRSESYKRKEDVIDDMSFNELIDYLIENPTMLRTPILYGREKTMFGYEKLEFELFMKRLTKV